MGCARAAKKRLKFASLRNSTHVFFREGALGRCTGVAGKQVGATHAGRGTKEPGVPHNPYLEFVILSAAAARILRPILRAGARGVEWICSSMPASCRPYRDSGLS